MNATALKKRNEKNQENITNRGQVQTTTPKDTGMTVGPYVVAFFLFVVVGSAVLQIFRP